MDFSDLEDDDWPWLDLTPGFLQVGEPDDTPVLLNAKGEPFPTKPRPLGFTSQRHG